MVGDENFKPSSAHEIASKLLFTGYMGTENSS